MQNKTIENDKWQNEEMFLMESDLQQNSVSVSAGKKEKKSHYIEGRDKGDGYISLWNRLITMIQ